MTLIGRVLDKYKILEEVGQGGMAVVYKGYDQTLKREVAVKILHPHLAGAEEARRRFEREAHAVAKLRHENILEIFDYSGKDSPESYIVTEFIRGNTLKGFIGEHKIAHPEIAAMITAETCRALAHAHGLGVLHRDVKPENIMIRDDGVLKLTDFGIAQIVDAQRMTVTGQLLGSPAYMSPEHVDGKPLDFRTDVFSVGILLYQLATGELPFTGKNPHEILKRIADCRYTDARQVNPLVGDRLNKIIARALAREPDDRYPDVGSMLDDLSRYLAEAELGEPRAELRQYFEKPAMYEQALRQRLIAAFTKHGRIELGDKRTAAALELFNRVLTLDPDNEAVLGEMERLSQRRRLTRVATGAFAACVVGAIIILGSRALSDHAVGSGQAAVGVQSAPVSDPHDKNPPTPDTAGGASTSAVATAPATTAAATTPAVAILASHPETSAKSPEKRTDSRPQATDPSAMHAKPHVTAVEVGPPRVFRVVPLPKNASIRLDDGPDTQVTKGALDVTVPPGSHTLFVQHQLCEPESIPLTAADEARTIQVHLRFKPARVIARCPNANIITVDGKPVDSGMPAPISGFELESKRVIPVEFSVGDRVETKNVEVTAGGTFEASCE